MLLRLRFNVHCGISILCYLPVHNGDQSSSRSNILLSNALPCQGRSANFGRKYPRLPAKTRAAHSRDRLLSLLAGTLTQGEGTQGVARSMGSG